MSLKVDGVQEMQDPEIIDLVIEQDLNGFVSLAVKFMIQQGMFNGRSVLISSLLFGSLHLYYIMHLANEECYLL